ncbi:MAG: sugar ABC transporter permease [Methanomassiliicoccales archaeon]|nr:sugar ABC transporter permease [Methanomassiliicoccales archaeon]
MKLKNEERAAYAMVGPALLCLLIFVMYPMCLAVYLSLTNSTVGRTGSFVGIDNFVWLFKTRSFRTTLCNVGIYLAVAVSLKTVLGILLALLLNRVSICPRLVRALILLPWVAPIALTTLAWRWLFDPRYSSINWALRSLGLIETNIPWLSFPTFARVAVITVNVWRGLPFFAVNFLAGLKGIPQELYEAAKVDGAGPFAQFRYITLPSLAPVLAIVLLFSTVMTISDFPIVFVLTRGGPIDTTHLLATLAYQVGLTGGFIGRGAAISLFLAPVLFVVVFLLLKLTRERWTW